MPELKRNDRENNKGRGKESIGKEGEE